MSRFFPNGENPYSLRSSLTMEDWDARLRQESKEKYDGSNKPRRSNQRSVPVETSPYSNPRLARVWDKLLDKIADLVARWNDAVDEVAETHCTAFMKRSRHWSQASMKLWLKSYLEQSFFRQQFMLQEKFDNEYKELIKRFQPMLEVGRENLFELVDRYCGEILFQSREKFMSD